MTDEIPQPVNATETCAEPVASDTADQAEAVESWPKSTQLDQNGLFHRMEYENGEQDVVIVSGGRAERLDLGGEIPSRVQVMGKGIAIFDFEQKTEFIAFVDGGERMIRVPLSHVDGLRARTMQWDGHSFFITMDDGSSVLVAPKDGNLECVWNLGVESGKKSGEPVGVGMEIMAFLKAWMKDVFGGGGREV